MKPLVIVTILVAALASSASAMAGSYEIQVCGGGPNKSWAPSATAGMVASPAPPKCGKGLTARHAIGTDGAKVPDHSAARFTFASPPGTSVTLLTFTGRFDTRGTKWQAALSNGSKILAGCPRGQSQCSEVYTDQLLPIPESGALYIEAFCTRGPCNSSRNSDGKSGHLYARARIHAASLTIKDPTPPTLANGGGSAWTSAWIGGKKTVSFDAHDGSGIIRVAAALDGTLIGQQTRACGHYAYTCGDWNGATLDVDLSKLADGQHSLIIGATDRGSNNGTATQQINVDNTPPTPPVNLASNVQHGWTSSPTVHLAWTNPVQQYAPIAGATVRACPAGQSGGCVTRDYDGADITQADYDLPGEGAWDVSVWLRDAAGNASPAQASTPLRLGLDRDPPHDLGFRPLDPDNPSVVHLRAVDDLSGIAGGEIDMRRAGTSSWLPLPAKVTTDGLSAQMPDGRLPNGRYRLRARVVDLAGNERSTNRTVSGKLASVRLPVRVAATMRVGRAKKVRAHGARHHRRFKTVYVRHPRVRHGKRTRVGGRLIAPGGNPLAGVPVDVSARLDVAGAPWRPVATLRTNRQGRFSYSLPPGRSRLVRFTYRGAPRIRPQQRTVHVRVLAASTISASRRHVVNGDPVTFSGRIQTGPQPATGKLVELQYYDRGEWRTFQSVHASASDGTWSFEYRFTGTSGTRTYRFRAHLPMESGYGYAAGASRSVKVTVRGL